MKSNYLFVFSIALSSMLFSCGNSETAENDEQNSESTENEIVEAAPKHCKLKSYSFQLGDKSRKLSFIYDGDNLKSLEMTEKDSDTKQSLDYAYNESGSLSAFSFDKNKATYTYAENGQLTEIKGEGNLNTRTFEYDENGNMIKQVTMFGGKPYTTHTYSYEGGTPTKVELSMKGELYESYAITYDDKNNPLQNKGVFANSSEMMFGYPVANFAHNIVTVVTTNKKGETEERSISYEYNENGYPTKEIRKRGNQEIVTEFDYDCE